MSIIGGQVERWWRTNSFVLSYTVYIQYVYVIDDPANDNQPICHGECCLLDPTLGAPVGLRHVRIAYGRDYGDVAPVRGVYKGQAGQQLSVDVRVRPALDGDGHEQLKEIASMPSEPPVSARSQQPGQQQQQQQQRTSWLTLADHF